MFKDCWPYAEFGGNYRAFLATLNSRQFVDYIVNLERNDMARGRPSKITQATLLLEALNFIKPGTNDFEEWQSFVRLQGQMAVSFNGQVAAGHPIVEELTLCPQLEKLKKALERCGKSLVIGETPTHQLSIKGDKLRALVPCFDFADLPPVAPDPMICALPETIKEAFKVCGTLATEAAERCVEASVLLEAYSCTGSNGASVLQYWHGVDLPPAMVLPKVFTKAVADQAKPIAGFGFSWLGDIVGTVTIWFEGGAWIKTQCYQDRWPDVASVLGVNNFPSDTLTGLFEAIEATSHFNDDEFVTFGDDKVMSHDTDAIGAQYEVKGLQGGKKFNGKLIKLVAPYATTIDLTTYPDRAFFFGGTTDNPVRGAIMALKAHVVETDKVEPTDDLPTEAEADQTQNWGN